MRDVDQETLELEALLAEDLPLPSPARRRAARTRALNAALDVYEHKHRRGIGAAVARHLLRSSAPAWHRITDLLESPCWNSEITNTVLRLITSLLALAVFSAALIATFMVAGS